LESQRMRSVRKIQRPGRKRVIVEFVEVAFVGEPLLCPNFPETLNEFSTASNRRD
jgi:hypothetical protein